MKPDPAFDTTLVLLSAAILVASFMLSLSPAGHVSFLGLSFPESCPTKLVFHRDCPGCGLSRSFVALAHGDLEASWRFNRIGPLFFLLVALQIPYRSYLLLPRRKNAWIVRLARFPAPVLIASLLVNWTLNVLSGRPPLP